MAGTAARRGGRRDPRRATSRPCSISIGGATRRSRCAAPAGIASTARSAPPGWSSTATASRLNCHHCGFSLPLPETCPKCGDADSLVACGPGVERIAEEVAERFPDARLALLSSDLVPGLTEMRDLIKSIEAGEADIIIGTQMVAKGHHFPDLVHRRHRRRRSRAWAPPIRAPPSAPSSCCTR